MEEIYDRDKLIRKKIPLNFDTKTWFPIQWIATFTYIAVLITIFTISYGFFRNLELKFTIGSLLNVVCITISQMYVYGGYITNTPKDIYLPAFVTIFGLIVDIALGIMGKQISLSYDIKNIIILYFLTYLQFIILYLVYRKVEYKEVSNDNILGDLQNIQKSNVDDNTKHFFI